MGELVVTREVEARVARPTFRDAFNAWFVTHEVAWELAMAAFAVVYVALGFLGDEVAEGARPEVAAIELGLTGIFVLEFGSRILAARSRTAYLRMTGIETTGLDVGTPHAGLETGTNLGTASDRGRIQIAQISLSAYCVAGPAVTGGESREARRQ